jgi:hypothetical protein
VSLLLGLSEGCAEETDNSYGRLPLHAKSRRTDTTALDHSEKPRLYVLLFIKLTADDTILDYQFPELNETYIIPASPSPNQDPELSHHSLLDLQPLPQFSDRRLPLVYNFKLSQATALTDHQDPITGEVRQRYYNTARHIGFSPITVGHMNPNIPMEPEAKVRARMPKLNQAILEKMRYVSCSRVRRLD